MPPKAPKAPVPLDDEEPSPAVQQQLANSSGIADFELPKTTLSKLAKGSIPSNVKMQQDVMLALNRSSTLFISYLTAAAHDQAHARSGKSITASDVIRAIAEMDFGPADALIPMLEKELAAYRANVQRAKASKARSNAASRAKGRKSQVQAGEEGSNVEDVAEERADDSPAEPMDEAEDH